MATSQETILSVVGVLVIVLAVVFYNNVRAMRETRSRNPNTVVAQPILQRYVHHEGSVVGQAIAIERDQVLLRQGTVHKVVPLAQLEKSGDDLRLLGTVDWMDAEREGAAWAARIAAAPAPAEIQV